jgi:hypothetical protein
MHVALHSALWVLALFVFTTLTVGLSLAGLSLGGALADHPVVIGWLDEGLAVRMVFPISGMAAGAALGLGMGFLFGNSRFITKG